jgi:hypothetical protein
VKAASRGGGLGGARTTLVERWDTATRDAVRGEEPVCEFYGVRAWVMPSLPKGTMDSGRG